jgi:hypothetical protein
MSSNFPPLMQGYSVNFGLLALVHILDCKRGTAAAAWGEKGTSHMVLSGFRWTSKETSLEMVVQPWQRIFTTYPTNSTKMNSIQSVKSGERWFSPCDAISNATPPQLICEDFRTGVSYLSIPPPASPERTGSSCMRNAVSWRLQRQRYPRYQSNRRSLVWKGMQVC